MKCVLVASPGFVKVSFVFCVSVFFTKLFLVLFQLVIEYEHLSNFEYPAQIVHFISNNFVPRPVR